MFCVVGLGNPDLTYQRNRHNIGFMVADALINRYAISKTAKKYSSELNECKFGDYQFFVQIFQTKPKRL